MADPAGTSRLEQRFTFLACISILLLGGFMYAGFTRNSIGLVDFYGLAAFSHGFVLNGAWPATPYFPAGYPLLLAPFGLLGNVLLGGYLLSFLSLVISVYALSRIGIELGIRSHVLLIGILLICCLDPLMHSCISSPSVDALFTAMSLLMLAAFIHLWQRCGHDIQPWAPRMLILSAALLPLLRYHALLVVLPLLVCLMLFCRSNMRLAVTALICSAAGLLLNSGIYQLSYGTPLQSAAPLQMRCGLEFRYLRHYGSPEELFASYVAFAEHARATPLLQDFSVADVATHTGRTFLTYLKRPATALALLFLLVLFVLRRRPSRLAMLCLLWVLLYSLALSPAYYTDRAAALPASLALLVCLSLLPALQDRRRDLVLLGGTLFLLLAGFLLTSETTWQRERILMIAAAHSRVLAREELSRDETAVDDWHIMPVEENPWCEPYIALEQSWLDDPLIFPEQKPRLKRLEPRDLIINSGNVRHLVISLVGEGEIPPHVREYVEPVGIELNRLYEPGERILITLDEEAGSDSGSARVVSLSDL